MAKYINNTERPIYAGGVILVPGDKKGVEITDKAITESPVFKQRLADKDIEMVSGSAPKKAVK